jgi:hypothetical protein
MSMPDDVNLLGAADQVEAVLRGEIRAPQVRGFFGETTFTASYVAHDAASKAAAIIPAGKAWEKADLPGGDALQLYRSIRRLMRLPARSRVFLYHDYKAPRRDECAWETTDGERPHP